MYIEMREGRITPLISIRISKGKAVYSPPGPSLRGLVYSGSGSAAAQRQFFVLSFELSL